MPTLRYAGGPTVYPAHINTKECRVGTARRHQLDMVALRQQFMVHEDVFEGVEVFRYLGHMLSQYDD